MTPTTFTASRPSKLDRTPAGAKQRACWLRERPGYCFEWTRSICLHCLPTRLEFWLFLTVGTGRA
jgi:hypothetical protein